MRIFSSKNTGCKIFCISMQRTGTTSVGQFFKDFNYNVADRNLSKKNQWSSLWLNGDFEAIFNSKDFLNNQVFEDDPWWMPEFYKVLYHRFPESKFILFRRDPENWFNSMMSHSNGKTLGNTKLHCKAFRRESEFYRIIQEKEILNYNENISDNLLELFSHRAHYISIYERRNQEIIDFFHAKNENALFVCDLEDDKKWIKLSQFMNLHLPEHYEVHENKSEK